MNTVYVLVVDKAWAKLYKTGFPLPAMTLLYHQALFGGRPAGESADEELARSLCRILRADRQSGKFGTLVMLASPAMLAALHRQYDCDWSDVVSAGIELLPARYTDEDVGAHVVRLLTTHLSQQQEAEAP